jgi:hypothetical protein
LQQSVELRAEEFDVLSGDACERVVAGNMLWDRVAAGNRHIKCGLKVTLWETQSRFDDSWKGLSYNLGPSCEMHRVDSIDIHILARQLALLFGKGFKQVFVVLSVICTQE